MSGFQKFEPAEFYERDIATGQLKFQWCTVAGRAEKYCLRLQRHSRFAILEYLCGHTAGLIGLVPDGDEARFGRRGTFGPEIFGEAFCGEADHGIGGVENGAGRAIVAVQRHHVGRLGKLRWKIENVTNGRRAKSIDRLRIVADHRYTMASGLHAHQDAGLQQVCILIFIDQDMVETTADFMRQGAVAHHMCPVKQQVIVIEHVLALFFPRVGGEQRLQFDIPLYAPRESGFQHVSHSSSTVHYPRINGEASGLGGKSAFVIFQLKLVPDEGHQVFGITTILDSERFMEADAFGVFAKQPCADTMKGACPREGRGCLIGSIAENCVEDAPCAALHLHRRAPGKCQQQHAKRVGAVAHRVCHAIGQCICLARARSGDDQQRAVAGQVGVGESAVIGSDAVFHCRTLLAIKRCQVVGRRGAGRPW